MRASGVLIEHMLIYCSCNSRRALLIDLLQQLEINPLEEEEE
jgi:hypothetical protein